MSLSLKEVLESLPQFSASDSPMPVQVGEAYLMRTIGYHWLGRVQAIHGKWIVLEDASWVADTGRYSEALAGNLSSMDQSELEPSPRPVIVNTDHITDCVGYPYQLPRSVK